MLNFSAALPLGCFDLDPSDSRGGDFSLCKTGTTDIPVQRPAQSSDPRSVGTLSFVCLGLHSNTQNKRDAQVLKLRWPRFQTERKESSRHPVPDHVDTQSVLPGRTTAGLPLSNPSRHVLMSSHHRL